MEKLSSEFHRELLADIEEGKEKSEVIDKLLEEDFSLFDAEGIYKELRLESEEAKRRKPVKKETFLQKLQKPKFSVLFFSLVTGVLIPVLIAPISASLLSVYLILAWMMHVMGHWLFCLISGNLPGTFIAREGVMFPKCVYLGQNSNITLSLASIGGILFSLVLGSLLVIYMVHLAKKTYHALNLDEDKKKLKYLAAWFNGTIGFQSLFMVCSGLIIGSSQELRLDIIDISQSLYLSDITVTLVLFWLFVIVAVMTLAFLVRMLWQEKKR
ncbi:MAG: hypothetical protein V1743_08130 [Nanoarchaeota archaeon]